MLFRSWLIGINRTAGAARAGWAGLNSATSAGGARRTGLNRAARTRWRGIDRSASTDRAGWTGLNRAARAGGAGRSRIDRPAAAHAARTAGRVGACSSLITTFGLATCQECGECH